MITWVNTHNYGDGRCYGKLINDGKTIAVNVLLSDFKELLGPKLNWQQFGVNMKSESGWVIHDDLTNEVPELKHRLTLLKFDELSDAPQWYHQYEKFKKPLFFITERDLINSAFSILS